jgi:hypothetical protein
MSAPQSQALTAIASQLVGALETYDADVARMVEAWPDPDNYRAVSDQIERIRMYSSALSEARVQWVELLISHAELVHVLWRGQYGHEPDARDQVDAVRERHQDCVVALRNRCNRLIARSSLHLS